MSGSFGGLTMALSAMYAHRSGLELTGQNIANANTEGYSRQRVDLRANGGSPVPAFHSIERGVAGAGVSVADVVRLRDVLLEARGRAEHSQDAYANTVDQAYGSIENVLAEPSDRAVAAQLSELWAAWHDVANNPGDGAARSQVLQRGSLVADGLRTAHDAYSSVWNGTRTDLDALTVEVNGIAAAVVELNQTIQRAHAAGLPANELVDQRDVHVMRLAELVGATAVARADGAVNVHVNGSTLVAGTSSRSLVVTGARGLPEQDTDPVTLRWADNDSPVVPGGQIAANLDIVTVVLPGQVAALDQVASRLADTVNTAHRMGYGLDGVNDRPFFTGTTAAAIAVAVTSPDHVAASGSPGGGLSGSNADALAVLGDRSDGADATYRDMTVGLGLLAQTAARRADIQSRVTMDIDAAREAGAGVNLDEEMTNMLAYQRAYEAAARLLTTIDGVLDVLINRTGLVGR
jgi:flagellar hook-associated protein 1 FlgK